MADSDHYIPRFLTRPWQRGNRHLRYFDFRTRTFGMKKAKKLFAARGLNDRETEQFCASTSRTRWRYSKTGSARRMIPRLCSTRRRSARSPRCSGIRPSVCKTSGKNATANEPARAECRCWRSAALEYVDQLAAAFWESDEPLLLCAGADEVIFFPESCFVVMPMLGDRPVLALPMSPGLLVAFVDRSANRDQILTNLRLRGRMTALSLGVSRHFDRVIISPTIEDPPIDVLRRVRAAARSVFSIQANARAVFGLPAWHLHD